MFVILIVLVGGAEMFVIGSVIGLTVAALFYRRRFVRGAIFGGLACVLIAALANLGSLVGAIMPWNGFLNDTPQSLWPACVVSGIAGGLLAGIGRRREKGRPPV